MVRAKLSTYKANPLESIVLSIIEEVFEIANLKQLMVFSKN